MRLRYQNSPGGMEILTPKRQGHIKPIGLWYSVGTEWKDWCLSECFKKERDLSVVYELDVNLNEILRLTTAYETLAFTATYGTDQGIDWEKVQATWHGIEIAPYQWCCRLDPATTWYYGWDVASGCLWHPEALLDYRLLPKETK